MSSSPWIPRFAPVVASLLLAACGDTSAPRDVEGAPLEGPIVAGSPVTATAETWTWIPIDGAECADGSATGIGVNLTTASDDVVVYLAGGGACWDDLSCFVFRSAAYLDGFGEAEFTAELPTLEAQEVVDRANASNPFKDASYVFVPYCTGDLHAGNEIHHYGRGTLHHVGGVNLEAILARLAATFTGTRRVFVAGSSAGGFGVQLRFHRFVEAFPDAEVHALADGAQPVQPKGDFIPSVRAAWNLQLPPGCTDCGTSFPALADHLAATWPTHRIGLTASTEDAVLISFFGYYDDVGGFDAATRALLDSDAYQASAAQRAFALKTADHTMLGNLDYTAASGLTLRDWLVRWRDGDAAWDNEAPAP